MCILRCHICICNKRQAQGIRTIQNSSEKAGGFHEIYSHLTPWESPPCHATIRMNCRGSPSIPTSTHVSGSVGYGFNNVPTCFFPGDHIWSTPGHGARSSSYPGLASGCPARFPMPWLVVKNDNDLTLANGSFEAGGSTWNSSCLIMFQPIPQISTVSNSIQQSICKMSPWGWSSHI